MHFCRGCDPLQCAAEGGHLEIFELLLRHDCNPMGQDHLNATLLHYAASGGNLDIMQKLLDLGCDMHALTKYGRSVLHYSAYGESPVSMQHKYSRAPVSLHLSVVLRQKFMRHHRQRRDVELD